MANTDLIFANTTGGNPLLAAMRVQQMQNNQQVMQHNKAMNPLLIAAQEAQNKQANLNLQSGQNRLDADMRQKEIDDLNLTLQRVDWAYQAADALSKLPDVQSRAASFQTLLPIAERLGIDLSSVTPDKLNDQDLAQFKAAMSVGRDTSQARLAELDAAYKQRSLDLQERRLNQEANQFSTTAGLREDDIALRQQEAERKAGEIKPTTQKILEDTQTRAIEAGRTAGRLNAIADEYERLSPTAGWAGSFTEALKEITGTEDSVSELRRQYLGIKASQVVDNLPPGAASDADVKLALSGFLSDSANPQTVASFLRGLAKIQKMEEEFQTFKADLISNQGDTRNLLPKWKERQAQMGSNPPSGAPSQTGTKAQTKQAPPGLEDVWDSMTPEEKALF